MIEIFIQDEDGIGGIWGYGERFTALPRTGESVLMLHPVKGPVYTTITHVHWYSPRKVMLYVREDSATVQ